MTAFIVITLVLFLLAMITNTIFILNENTQNKGGAVLGLMVFTAMSVWGMFLLFS